jgi:homoaconitase/3-isopropylmalate dehydratase large subunit
MLAKIWDQHVIARLSEDTDLLHIDRHLLHDLGGSRGLLDVKNRDVKILVDGGYRIEGVTPVDQFRHTPHVELVARLSR